MLTGHSLKNKFCAREATQNIDLEILSRLFRGGEAQDCVAYVVRSAIPEHICKKFSENFNAIIAEGRTDRESTEYVPVHQIGASQFQKTGAEYFKQIRTARKNVSALLGVFSPEELEKILLEQQMAGFFSRDNIVFRPAAFHGDTVLSLTARSWKNEGNFSLKPHEDKAQLKSAAIDQFEIASVDQVVVHLMCIQSGQGGDLIIWDMAPDDATRKSLGLEMTGYPYPEELVKDIPQIRITLKTGDICFFNNNFLHAVSEVRQGYRITASRFMGLRATDNIVYWT